jgi:hypothetical protein
VPIDACQPAFSYLLNDIIGAIGIGDLDLMALAS